MRCRKQKYSEYSNARIVVRVSASLVPSIKLRLVCAAKGEECYSPASDDFEAPVWKPRIVKPDDDDHVNEASEGTPKASPIADSPGICYMIVKL